jgi:hypothetical protein
MDTSYIKPKYYKIMYHVAFPSLSYIETDAKMVVPSISPISLSTKVNT